MGKNKHITSSTVVRSAKTSATVRISMYFELVDRPYESDAVRRAAALGDLGEMMAKDVNQLRDDLRNIQRGAKDRTVMLKRARSHLKELMAEYVERPNQKVERLLSASQTDMERKSGQLTKITATNVEEVVIALEDNHGSIRRDIPALQTEEVYINKTVQ